MLNFILNLALPPRFYADISCFPLKEECSHLYTLCLLASYPSFFYSFVVCVKPSEQNASLLCIVSAVTPNGRSLSFILGGLLCMHTCVGKLLDQTQHKINP